MSRSIKIVPLLAASLMSLQASELVVRNLNFSVEFLPSAFEYELSDSTTTRTGEDEFERNIGIAIGSGWSFAGPGESHGILALGQLVLSQAAYGSVGNLTTYGLRAGVGYGWQFSDHLGFSLNARAGYRLATFDITSTSTFPAASQSGGGLEYGAALYVDYALSERWLLTADVGYLNSELNLTGSAVETKMTITGAMVALGFSYRFSSAPRPLE